MIDIKPLPREVVSIRMYQCVYEMRDLYRIGIESGTGRVDKTPEKFLNRNKTRRIMRRIGLPGNVNFDLYIHPHTHKWLIIAYALWNSPELASEVLDKFCSPHDASQKDLVIGSCIGYDRPVIKNRGGLYSVSDINRARYKDRKTFDLYRMRNRGKKLREALLESMSSVGDVHDFFPGGGEYVCKEIVIDYALWVDADMFVDVLYSILGYR